MKKALRIIGVVVVVGILFAAIVTSMTRKTPNSDRVWDIDTTVGNIDAGNYFIIYSDIATGNIYVREGFDFYDKFKEVIEIKTEVENIREQIQNIE